MKNWRLDRIGAWLVFAVVAGGVCVLWETVAISQQPHYAGGAALMKVPLTGAAWVPPDQQQPPPVNPGQLDRIEAKLDRLLKLLEEATAGPDPAGAGLASPPAALIDALGTCVSCHADRAAKQKGDGFVLFTSRKDDDGKEQSVFRDDFSARELRNIRREVEEGLMPKKTSGKTLTAEQKSALLTEVKTMIARRDSESK